MNKRAIQLCLILLISVLALAVVSAANESDEAPANATKEASASKPKYSIPGGTKKFLSKQQMRQRALSTDASSFPYDLDEAVEWVRANKLSLPDPVTKRSLLVTLMSDDEIKSYLVKPVGRKLSGIDQAGLTSKKGMNAGVVLESKAGRSQYGFGSFRQDIKEKLAPSVSGKKELPYYLGQNFPKASNNEPPQSKNLGEEIAWVRGNLQSVYDPFRKQTMSVGRASEDYLKYLLKAPQVRKSLGLPPLPEGSFSKSTKY